MARAASVSATLSAKGVECPLRARLGGGRLRLSPLMAVPAGRYRLRITGTSAAGARYSRVRTVVVG